MKGCEKSVEQMKEFPIVKWRSGERGKARASIPREFSLTVFFNQVPLVTILATPNQLRELAVGFLYTEGFLKGRDELERAELKLRQGEVWVESRDKQGGLSRLLDQRPLGITSGCGKGVTFSHPSRLKGLRKLTSKLTISPDRVFELMKKMFSQASLYRRGGGIHCSALCDRERVIAFSEDIARHNTIDKILGQCLLEGIKPEGKILLTSGRLSSEMLLKTLRARIPLIASHTSPTNLTVELGEKFGVTVIGYLRAGRMSIYTHPRRIKN